MWSSTVRAFYRIRWQAGIESCRFSAQPKIDKISTPTTQTNCRLERSIVVRTIPTTQAPPSLVPRGDDNSGSLTERLRPYTLAEFVGQEHLLGEGKPLRVLIEGGLLPSMILYGPPGIGKTTLVRLMAEETSADLVELNGLSSPSKDVHEILNRAETNRKQSGKQTILFIDEIDHSNMMQEGALLRSAQAGEIILVGATPRHPSFTIGLPLLSSMRIFFLHPLAIEHLSTILDRAMNSDPQLENMEIDLASRNYLVHLACGDARIMLWTLENLIKSSKPDADKRILVGRKEIEEAFQRAIEGIKQMWGRLENIGISGSEESKAESEA